MPDFPRRVMVDTGYWYAICDRGEQAHSAATTRFTAFEQTVRTARRRPMSLVDMVMRLMLEDVNVRVNGLLTFNRRDFYDVCRRRGLEML